MSTQTIAAAKCQEIYREAQIFFSQIPYWRNYGFKILNGPPLFQPPILFIGYQPGGGSDDFELETALGSDKHWPATCEYATASWKLAKKMRLMFEQQFLAQCVGMNAIFLRSPRVLDYKRDFDETMRAQIRRFCLPRVGQIIEAIDPLEIVVIGLDTLKLFEPPKPQVDLKSKQVDPITKKKRTLITVGQIGGRRALATLHLSGVRPPISTPDFELIRDRVLTWCNLN